MHVEQAQIRQLAEGIWSSMLGLTLEPCTDVVNLGSSYYSGAIQITGAWDGEVALECSAPLARELAAAMFGMEADRTGAEEIRDALGELTNMLGGNLKALLPGPSQLSLPTVAEGLDHVDYTMRRAGNILVGELAFRCEGNPMRVLVVKPGEAATQVVGTPSEAPSLPVESPSVKVKHPSPAPLPATAPVVGGSVSPPAPLGARMSPSSPTTSGDVVHQVSRMTQEAQRLLDEAREEAAKIRESARAEADHMIKTARADVRGLVESSEIRLIASREAVEIVAAAEAHAEEIRSGARDYAADLLNNLNQCLQPFMESVEKSQEWLRSR